MSDNKYNGWSNYATWRINLEIFDGVEPESFGLDEGEEMTLVDVHEFSEAMKSYADEIIFSELRYDERRPSSLIEDYARAFLSDVNWYEIATHFIDNFKE